MARPRATGPSGTPLAILVGVHPPGKAAAQALLRAHGFRDPARVLAALGRLHADELQRRSLARIFPHLMRACARSADPDRAAVNFERLVTALPNPNMLYHYLEAAPDRLDWLVCVFAHSQALADTLTRDAKYFHFLIAPEMLEKPREKKWLAAELERLLLPIRQPAERYHAIRRFRRRETLRLGARDLLGRATVEQTTAELSNLADVCLEAVLAIALDGLRAQFKLPAQPGDAASRLAIIGLGKLGGQELNYSSDVDVIFVYDEEGEFSPQLSRHQFFTKLAEEIIRAVGAASEEGHIFRIDLRLRPEGASGPLVRSLESCENYYAQWGETWERLALIKARPVAGDAAVGAEFVRMLQPFVYARQAPSGVVREMAAVKQRIEREVVRADELARHVKLGIGGIREIEFIVQCLQVMHGGRLPVLRERNTLRALELVSRAGLLKAEEAEALARAYRFLRNVEHRLQMEMELQTHTIPDEERALYRLARSLGFDTVEKFLGVEQTHTAAVRAVYRGVLAEADEDPAGSAEDWLAPERLARELARAGFAEAGPARTLIEHLLHGPGFVHVSQRTKELFGRVAPALLAWAGRVADPDGALLRFEQFVTAYGSRAMLYEILASHPRLVELLVRLGDASRYFSETLVHQPELFDEICRGVTLAEPKRAERMLEELEAEWQTRPAADAAAPSARGQSAEWLAAMEAARTWKRAELLRIGLEDVMELADLEAVQQELSWLAEVCLRFALERARAELKVARLPFAVIGLGKFGGSELGYGADLDVLFVGGRDAAATEPAIRLAAAVMAFMERQTAAGVLFRVDPRLRPDGEKGPLAATFEAHREYYRKRAQLWERQALTKARLVAGDQDLGERFIEMTQEIVYEREFTVADAEEIRRMRRRIETERVDPKQVGLEFKTGPGGMMDVEFVIQAFQLRYGRQHPPVRTAHTLAALNRLTSIGVLDDEASFHLRRGYLFLRAIESVLRRIDNTSVSRLPSTEREQALLARRLGYAKLEDFLSEYRLTTRRIRGLYEQLMPGGKTVDG